MSDVAAKLGDLNMKVDDNMLVHFALNSLPEKYENIKANYFTQKEKWSIDELIAICAQEEGRNNNKTEIANLVHASGGKKAWGQKHGKGPKTNKNASNVSAKANPPPQTSNKLKTVKTEIAKCHFCKRHGHLRKDCEGFKAWLVKKGTQIISVFVCVESNLILVPPNSWWFDTGCSIHITNCLQAFIRERTPSNEIYKVFVGNGTQVAVESIGSVKLRLSTGFILELKNVLYVPSMRRSLISVSKLVKDGFCFLGDDVSIRLFHKNKVDNLLGSAFLNCDLWQLDCSYFDESYFVENSTSKRMLINDHSMLWHRILGHIPKDRISQMINHNMLPKLNFTDLQNCIACYKGKLTKIKKVGSKRSQNLLEIIHTDVCGPFPTKTICGKGYFVTFIDDFSRFSFVYLISEKPVVLDCFKLYKLEV